VLRSFASFHEFGAGVAIGGKKVDAEKDLIRGINILVTTPGRLLQHMDETPDFHYEGVKAVVIDEVDRILDMGFKETIDQIMRNLPKQGVQTLLFSATVGKQLKELARVNLKEDHEYISIHDFETVESLANDFEGSKEDRELNERLKSITPVKLLHHCMTIKLEDKLDTLFSFLKSHNKSKCLVFFSACK